MARQLTDKYWDPKVETMSADEMAALQLEKLKKQLAYNYNSSLLYKSKFEQAGMRPEDVRSWEIFAAFPVTGKDERREPGGIYRRTGPSLRAGTITCAAQDKIVRLNSTSGTTGTPTLYALTQHDVNIMNELHARRLWMVGIRPGHRVLQGLRSACLREGYRVAGHHAFRGMRGAGGRRRRYQEGA